jgi:FKBP-type peptidyl-prolyl cis-trans isomerase
VKVHYTGTLIDGTVFDSSVQRGEPAEFPLDQVIAGWTEGIQKMNKGGKIKLYVPPQLAYGDDGRPGIPPGSTLIFDVELLDIKPTAPSAPAMPQQPAKK